jgi:predicted permease
MHISSLFFIVVIATVCLFGGIMAAGTYQANNPVNQSDSLGNMPSASTNATNAMIGNVTAFEEKGSGWMIVLIAVFVIICVIIGGMVMLRSSNLGGKRYRT